MKGINDRFENMQGGAVFPSKIGFSQFPLLNLILKFNLAHRHIFLINILFVSCVCSSTSSLLFERPPCPNVTHKRGIGWLLSNLFVKPVSLCCNRHSGHSTAIYWIGKGELATNYQRSITNKCFKCLTISTSDGQRTQHSTTMAPNKSGQYFVLLH